MYLLQIAFMFSNNILRKIWECDSVPWNNSPFSWLSKNKIWNYRAHVSPESELEDTLETMHFKALILYAIDRQKPV